MYTHIHIHTHTHIYIYIYIYTSICCNMLYCVIILYVLYNWPDAERGRFRGAANLPTRILDFKGFDSSRILILRGGILMSVGNFPESLSQGILAGVILVRRLGVGPGSIGSTPARLRSRGVSLIEDYLHKHIYIYRERDVHIYIYIYTERERDTLSGYVSVQAIRFRRGSVCLSAAAAKG